MIKFGKSDSPISLNHVLVAPNSRVIYSPTPKAACTTIKTMLAQAEGCFRPELIDRLAVGHLSRRQTIHHPQIHGLKHLGEFSPNRRQEFLNSSEWFRFTGIRNPIARTYSAWLNRIFLRAHRRDSKIIETAPDVLVDGRVDLVSSFSLFVERLAENQGLFFSDQHFVPQTHLVHALNIPYTEIIQIDQPGQLKVVADELSRRSNRTVGSRHLNEGLGIPVERICNKSTGELLKEIYSQDFMDFQFPMLELPTNVEPLVLADLEQRLLNNYRSAAERVFGVAKTARNRIGARYGASQLVKASLRTVRARSGIPEWKRIQ